MKNTTRIYGNAVASYNFGRLLTREQIRRLADATYDEAVKIVTDSGYGGGVLSDKRFNVDRLIAEEIAALIAYVESDSPDEMLTRCLTARFIYANAKTYYKNKFVTVDLEAALYRMDGNETLKKAVEMADYAPLSEPMAQAFLTLDAAFSDSPAASKRIDSVLTAACYGEMVYCAKKSKSKMLQKYVASEIDFNNLSAVLRAKAMGYDGSKTNDMLIEGGTLSEDDLMDALNLELAQIAQMFYATPYGEVLTRLQDGAKLSLLASESDDFLYELTNREADNMLGLSPFVGYFSAKLTELKAVKLILTCLKNNAREQILPRLGAVYTAV